MRENLDDAVDNPEAHRKPLEASNGYAAEAFSWGNLALDLVGANSTAWFGGLHPVTPREAIARRGWSVSHPLAATVMPYFFGDDPELLLPDLLVDPDELGESVPINASPLGNKLIGVLDELGVHWEFETVQVTGPDDENPGAILRVDVNHQLEGVGRWSNGFNTPIIESFRIYRQSDGSEQILWFTDVLAASRAYSHMIGREVAPADDEGSYVWVTPPEEGELPQGLFAEQLAIPRVAKRAFFLAETPTPSTQILGLSRAVAYPEVDEQSYPKPTVFYERDSFTQGVTNNDTYMGSLFPTVVKMGWRIGDVSAEQLRTIIPVITDGLTKLSTIFEDGYRNFNRADFPAYFDLLLDSAAVLRYNYSPEVSAAGYSRWIPVSLVGMKVQETVELATAGLEYDEIGNDLEAESALRRVAADGVGIMVSNITNTLAFSYMLPQGEYAYAAQLLDSASRLPAGYQADNAYSNRGIAHYLLEEFDDAERIFRELLELPGNPCAAEANYYLAQICEATGRASEAANFRRDCEAAGGYVPFDAETAVTEAETAVTDATPPNADAPAPAPAPAAAPVAKPQANFCSQCGSPRANAEALFCVNCGSEL